jgi:hypothetical protein
MVPTVLRFVRYAENTPMQGLAVLSPLLAPLVRLLVSLFWRLGPGLTAFLPSRVRALLAAPSMRADLAHIVAGVAGYSHLSNSERRDLALDLVAHWLRKHGFDLTDHELALLVELLYGWVKRRRPRTDDVMM